MKWWREIASKLPYKSILFASGLVGAFNKK